MATKTVDTTSLLTPTDITAMEKIAIKKAEIKKLETAHNLSCKRANTYKKYEKHADDTDAVLVQIGAKYIRLKKTTKRSIEWAKLASANLSDAKLESEKKKFKKPDSISYKAEVKGREAIAATLTKIPKVA